MLIGTGIFVFLLMTGVICGAFCTRNRRQQDRTQLLPAQICKYLKRHEVLIVQHILRSYALAYSTTHMQVDRQT